MHVNLTYKSYGVPTLECWSKFKILSTHTKWLIDVYVMLSYAYSKQCSFDCQVHSSDLEKVPQPSPEMTGYRRSVDHFGLRGSGSDSKLSIITASPATVSQPNNMHKSATSTHVQHSL